MRGWSRSSSAAHSVNTRTLVDRWRFCGYTTWMGMGMVLHSANNTCSWPWAIIGPAITVDILTMPTPARPALT